MVLAGVASYDIYEKCFFAKSAVYPGNEVRLNIGVSGFSSFSQDCLGEKKGAGGKDAMSISGWAFLILSWGLILALTVFCFIKVFSKKELK